MTHDQIAQYIISHHRENELDVNDDTINKNSFGWIFTSLQNHYKSVHSEMSHEVFEVGDVLIGLDFHYADGLFLSVMEKVTKTITVYERKEK